MIVTKLIKEHVTRVVSEKYEKDIAAISMPEPFKIPDGYKEWAEEYIKEIIETCAQKRKEYGFETYSAETVSKNNSWYDYDRSIKLNLERTIIPTDAYIRDIAFEKYNEKKASLNKECAEKIEDILVSLELGQMKKDELDEVLAEYK